MDLIKALDGVLVVPASGDRDYCNSPGSNGAILFTGVDALRRALSRSDSDQSSRSMIGSTQ